MKVYHCFRPLTGASLRSNPPRTHFPLEFMETNPWKRIWECCRRSSKICDLCTKL